jgi:transposase
MEDKIMARGKKYTQEFKDSAVQLVLNSEEPVRQIAKDLEISEKTLYGWIRDYKIKHNLEVSQKNKKTVAIESIEEENKRLRRENALLKKEREILKKAAAYFAKETM